MIKKKPETPPNITMTPVQFSPSESADAVGTVAPPPRQEPRFPLFIPVFIILLTLIFTTVRDIAALNKRMSAINEDEAPALEMLKNEPRQTDLVQGLRSGLQKLSPSDPVAARLLTEFFPPDSSGPSGNGDAASSPASK